MQECDCCSRLAFHPGRTAWRTNSRPSSRLRRTLSMATQAQIDANRRNAQKSTGPRTPDGKAAVRQNAFRHGLSATYPLLSDEHDDAFESIHTALIEENEPVGVNEEILVYKMAEHFFFQRRAPWL